MSSVAAPAATSSRRPWRRPADLLRRFRSLPIGVQIGAVITGIIALAALFAPLIAPYGENQLDFAQTLAPPSAAHLFGTDEAGRAVFSRTLYGLRLDLALALLVTYVPLPVGALAGAVAGYFGGATDGVISRLADVMIAFPFIVLIIAVVAIVGPGASGFLIGVPIASWALYARLARSEMLVLREQPFMLATAALGFSRRRAIFRHALPNLLRPCLVYSTLDLVGNLLLLAGLSYLGLGIQPPTADLGAIISNGQSYLLSAWWISTLPGLVLVLFGVGFGLVGEGLADRSSKGGR
ncbi:MAG: ABC transporter permease [Actinobacteria bacterium]|nr:ABC transporter permease [Actinomycetota bacterium]